VVLCVLAITHFLFILDSHRLEHYYDGTIFTRLEHVIMSDGEHWQGLVGGIFKALTITTCVLAVGLRVMIPLFDFAVPRRRVLPEPAWRRQDLGAMVADW
jgi:hypothetical protein